MRQFYVIIRRNFAQSESDHVFKKLIRTKNKEISKPSFEVNSFGFVKVGGLVFKTIKE